MRKFYVVGNLKMNLLSRDEADQYLSLIIRESEGKIFPHVVGILCPPTIYLERFDRLPEIFRKGVQNVFWEKSGAFTGETSPAMAKNEGAEYTLVGHSERRLYAGETDAIVREKVAAALKQYLTPIVCIGETGEERKDGMTAATLERQLKSVFSGLSKLQAEKIIVAYEPRWAIGTDRLPEKSEIFEVGMLIRTLLTEWFDKQTADRVMMLYGGSVKSVFLPQVLWEAGMDGVLVGRESLFPYEIIKMMQLCEDYAISEERVKEDDIH